MRFFLDGEGSRPLIVQYEYSILRVYRVQPLLHTVDTIQTSSYSFQFRFLMRIDSRNTTIGPSESTEEAISLSIAPPPHLSLSWIPFQNCSRGGSRPQLSGTFLRRINPNYGDDGQNCETASNCTIDTMNTARRSKISLFMYTILLFDDTVLTNYDRGLAFTDTVL